MQYNLFSLDTTHAKPKAISPQTPSLIFKEIWTLQRNIMGRMDKMISVAAAIANCRKPVSKNSDV